MKLGKRFGLAFACAALAAGAAMAQALVPPAQWPTQTIAGEPAPVVGLRQGRAGGVVLPSGVKAYLGLPFAQPPIGPLRWREPQAPTPWAAVRQAVSFPPMCVQGIRGPGQNHFFGTEPTSEDCLYLNVWTPPAARAGQKLPVVVWIYGGGFTGGSSAMMWARGETLARKGVVYVSLNYRVGGLGFMAHPELSRESGHGSGAYGFLDQIAGLRWVKDNIAAFGGDPDNVTLLGQSAGSMSLAALQASPLAKGLFRREIGLSGNVITAGAGSMVPLADAEKSGVALQTTLGARSIEEMRRLPADRVASVRGIRFEPNVDGWFMPRDPKAIFAAGEQNDAGLLIGFTRDEGFSALSNAKSADDYAALARRSYGAAAEELLRRYPADANWARNARNAGRDVSLSVGTWRWAKAQTAPGKQPAYGYMFSRVHPYADVTFIDHDPKTVGAYHAGDIVYWTGNLDAFNAFRVTRNWTPTDRRLSEAMSDMVVAFARTGNPATPTAPVPRFDPNHPRMIELGDEIRAIDWPGAANLQVLDAMPAPAAPAASPAPAGPPSAGSLAGPRF